MKEAYLLQWLHAYISHFGAWVTFGLGVSVSKYGAPKLEDLFPLLKVVIVISLIGGLFSSNSQIHYLRHTVTKVAESE